MARLIGTIVAILSFVSVIAVSSGLATVRLVESKIDKYWWQAKYQDYPGNVFANRSYVLNDTSSKAGLEDQGSTVRHKSPGKAFALSMLVPGLGQYYNGSKIKAATFFGIEATSWILQFKWRSDGNRLTDEFETFQETHWSEGRYGDYLQWAYQDSLGMRYRDDDSISATELSHHLPDTRTQQYYEMTGKYDQFAWGWDDARLNNRNLQYYVDSGGVPRAVGANVPISPNRLTYETMRYDANKKFSNARKMIMVALGNRLVSALEAFISAKRSQDKQPSISKGSGKGEFSHWRFHGKLRSVYAKYDTPYVKVTYGF